jgi:ATP-dependent protease HslVU (ClpYQ) peptidase subunit
MSDNSSNNMTALHGTTILCVRKNEEVVITADGQISNGGTVLKLTAKNYAPYLMELLSQALQGQLLTL